jgi:membrane protease subunit HflC
MSRFGMILLVILGLTLFVAANAFFIVHQTEQVLVLQFGRPVTVYRMPGLKFKLPFMQNVVFFDKRLLNFGAEPQEIITADKKRLIVDAFVRYRITDILPFYQSVRDERGMQSRLRAITESALRQALSRIPMRALLSDQRSKVMAEIRDALYQEMRGAASQDLSRPRGAEELGFGIEIVDVRIMRADLPAANSEAIYSRMKTERQREAKEYRAQGAEEAQRIRAKADKDRTVLLAEAGKQAEIIRGEGDGEAAKIFAEASGRDPGFFEFYRSLQAYRKTLRAKDTTMILSPGSGFLDSFQGK